MRKLRWAATFSLFLLLIGGRYPLYYEVEPVSCRLVDAETKEPIENAAVNVIWTMVKSSYHSNSSSAGWLGSQYATSNMQGEFSVPGWKVSWLEWFSTKRISNNTPELRILRSGYKPVMITIPHLKEKNPRLRDQSSVMSSFWGKKVVKGIRNATIKLESLPLDPMERYKAFHKTFVLPISEKTCSQPKIMNSTLVSEIYQEQKRAILAGLELNLSNNERDEILDFKQASVDSCLKLAKYLRKQEI